MKQRPLISLDIFSILPYGEVSEKKYEFEAVTLRESFVMDPAGWLLPKKTIFGAHVFFPIQSYR